MTTVLHPLQTTDLIRRSYLRYLTTIYPFQDQSLREQFKSALQQAEAIVKGPLLEAAPPFKTGASLGQLIEQGILNPAFKQLCGTDLPLNRPLYLHQDQAIRKVVAEGRNLIVATGTGSGKTESFLIPILNYLLQQQATANLGPGVRALLLYPMNALANDQLKRLRHILKNYPAITFGRYTGETEEQDDKAEDRFRQQFPNEPRLPNELISRIQMRANPPHILLTNYAMLEYLLLRPKDTAFFDGDTANYWRFIVVDEAHVYNGAVGIEIAMLLRRLKDRIVQSKPGRLCCLATSATLGKDETDYPAAVAFAKNLFAEQFEWEPNNPSQQDVVAATRIPPTQRGTPWGKGSPAFYNDLWQVLTNVQPSVTAFIEVAKKHRLPPTIIEAVQQIASTTPSPHTVQAVLYTLLQGDAHLHTLQAALLKKPYLLSTLAQQLFSSHQQTGSTAPTPQTEPTEVDPEATESLITLINLATRAKKDPADLSLLPARYHVFAKALEGAFACLHPSQHPANTPHLFLNRHETCPHCNAAVFELANCNRCGSTYIIGQLSKDKTTAITYLQQVGQQVTAYKGELAYFVTDLQLLGLDEDEAVVAEEDLYTINEEVLDTYTLCLQCTAISPGLKQPPDCNCGSIHHQPIYRVDLQDKPELTRCVSCGARRGHGLIYRFLTGQDAPVSVLATALYQSLPPSTDPAMANLPGQGRKLLSFADSRQDAAFFAPYMERTYNQILRRRLILKALLSDPGGQAGRLRLQDMVSRVLTQAEDIGYFEQSKSYDERTKIVYTWLMKELIALDRRMSLEGLGFIHFRLLKPQGWVAPAPLLSPPWNLTPDQAWQLTALLLDTLRQQGVVQFPDQLDPRDEAFAPRNRALYIRGQKAEAKKGVFAWEPSRGSNRRRDILSKLLARLTAQPKEQCTSQANDILQGLWRYFTAPGSVWQEHLPTESLRGIGIVNRLSHLFWEVVPILETNTPLYRCTQCRNISYIKLHQLCPTYGCQGNLEVINPTDLDIRHNHYRYLYQHLQPIPFTAQEHTAQWTAEIATKIQDEFIRGKLNALSCSTTFELGVDVGELQAVLMRNVPPTTANYVQRAGRAGRRTDSAAFALTYAQRRSHDLTHYAHPERIVAGQIRPPAISLTNEKIVRRHTHSVLFAAFFRHVIDVHNRQFTNVGQFFSPAETTDQPTGPELLRQFANQHPPAVLAALKRIIPTQDAVTGVNLQAELGLEDWAWLNHLYKLENEQDHPLEIPPILDIATAEIQEDLKLLQEMEIKASADKNYKLAAHFQGIQRTFRKRHLLGFLGSRNVLPKYGFPSDVVELRTRYLQLPQANQVELQRDLRIAIGEYAPGSEVVAAKKIWRSGGIYKRPEREWPCYEYAVCPECNRFHSSLDKLPQTCTVCGSNLYSGYPRNYGTYIIPEFGFIVSPTEPRPSTEQRPQRFYTSRVYFADYEKDREPTFEVDESISSLGVQVWHRYSRHGWLAVVNAGKAKKGFRVCVWCGFAESNADVAQAKRPKKPKAHKNPRTNKDCKGFIKTYHLGHRFMTDILEIEFRGRAVNNLDYALWWSVLYALLEGASQTLDINRSDLDGTLYRHQNNPVPALVLFDSVPGGAGHVKRIKTELRATFETTLDRLARCECGLDTSCYECLRNFYNQVYHEQLKRGLALDFLRQVLETQVITA